jgi:hypothetical protein
MTTPQPDDPDFDRIDHDIRMNELKQLAADAAGGEMVAWEADDAPRGLVESFWSNVANYEESPDTSEHELLARDGIDLPPPGSLDDEALHAKLWEVIQALAKRDTFMSNTNHLSDRELYTHMVEEMFHEITKDMSAPGWVHHYDILGGCSEEDIENSFRYYADDEERARWMAHWPDYVMPEKVKPPYDRDRWLPKAAHDLPLPPEGDGDASEDAGSDARDGEP